MRGRSRREGMTDRYTHGGEDEGGSVVLCLCRGRVGGVLSGVRCQVWALWSRSIAPEGVGILPILSVCVCVCVCGTLSWILPLAAKQG